MNAKGGNSLNIVQLCQNLLKHFFLREDYFLLTLTLSAIGGEGDKTNWFFCHPERIEESQAFENTRFFAALRMTIVIILEFCKCLFWQMLHITIF